LQISTGLSNDAGTLVDRIYCRGCPCTSIGRTDKTHPRQHLLTSQVCLGGPWKSKLPPRWGNASRGSLGKWRKPVAREQFGPCLSAGFFKVSWLKQRGYGLLTKMSAGPFCSMTSSQSPLNTESFEVQPTPWSQILLHFALSQFSRRFAQAPLASSNCPFLCLHLLSPSKIPGTKDCRNHHRHFYALASVYSTFAERLKASSTLTSAS
jgi:hypothetical protein